ncbi:hypothetical protein [Schistocephalus solidus toti-like virus 1]|nr:hypothetical protein [Schistocephalus solidus toti-like virus 1]
MDKQSAKSQGSGSEIQGSRKKEPQKGLCPTPSRAHSGGKVNETSARGGTIIRPRAFGGFSVGLSSPCAPPAGVLLRSNPRRAAVPNVPGSQNTSQSPQAGSATQAVMRQLTALHIGDILGTSQPPTSPPGVVFGADDKPTVHPASSGQADTPPPSSSLGPAAPLRPIASCVACAQVFTTPAAYASHLKSAKHLLLAPPLPAVGQSQPKRQGGRNGGAALKGSGQPRAPAPPSLPAPSQSDAAQSPTLPSVAPPPQKKAKRSFSLGFRKLVSFPKLITEEPTPSTSTASPPPTVESIVEQRILDWDALLQSTKLEGRATLARLPSTNPSERWEAQVALYKTFQTWPRKMSTLPQWFFHYGTSLAPTLSKDSFFEWPDLNLPELLSYQSGITSINPAVRTAEATIRQMLACAPLPCRLLTYWGSKEAPLLSKEAFVHGMREHRCPYCMERTSADDHPNPQVINIIHLLSPFLFDLAGNSTATESAVAPSYLRTTFCGSEVTLKGGFLPVWLMYVRLLAIQATDSGLPSDYGSVGLSGDYKVVTNSIVTQLAGFANGFLIKTKRELAVNAPLLFPDLSTLPALRSSFSGLLESKAKASAEGVDAERMRHLEEKAASAELLLTDQLQRLDALSQEAVPNFGDFSSKLAAFYDYTRTQDAALSELQENIHATELTVPVSNKLRARFETAKRENTARIHFLRTKLHSAADELTALIDLIPSAKGAPALSHQHDPKRVKGLDPELQNLAYFSAAMASAKSKLRDLLLEGQSQLLDEDDWVDPSEDVKKRGAGGRSFYGRFTAPIVPGCPKTTYTERSGRETLAGPSTTYVSASTIYTPKEAGVSVKHSAAARACALISQWKAEPHRIRGLIAASHSNHPMLMALREAVTNEFQTSGSSLLRLIDGLRRALLRDVSLGAEARESVQARRQAILSLVERKNSSLLLTGDITPEAVRAYGGEALSLPFYNSLESILNHSPQAFSRSMKAWNKWMHSINGNIFSPHEVNWHPNAASKVTISNTDVTASREDRILPEASFSSRARPDWERYLQDADRLMDIYYPCEDRIYELSPQFRACVTAGRDFFAGDSAASAWGRMARTTPERAGILTLVPSFESGVKRAGSWANYAALRIALLRSNLGHTLNLIQPQGAADNTRVRVIRLHRIAFNYRVVVCNPMEMARFTQQGEVSVGHWTHELDEQVASYVHAGVANNALDSHDRDLLTALFNVALVDIDVTFPDSPNTLSHQILPRLHFNTAARRPSLVLIRVVVGRPDGPSISLHAVAEADINMSAFLNTHAMDFLSTSSDPIATPVTNQTDLFGFVASTCGITTDGGSLGLVDRADQGDSGPVWDCWPDCGFYYHALVEMGLLVKSDEQSTGNPGYSPPLAHISVDAFFEQLKGRIATLREVWDSYQCKLADGPNDAVLSGARGDLHLPALMSKSSFISSQFGTPGLSFYKYVMDHQAQFADCTDLTRTVVLHRWDAGDPMLSPPSVHISADKVTLGIGQEARVMINNLDNLNGAKAGNNYDAVITDDRYVFYDDAGHVIPRAQVFAPSRMCHKDAQGHVVADEERFVFHLSNGLPNGYIGLVKKQVALRVPILKKGSLQRIYFEEQTVAPGLYPNAVELVALTPADLQKMSVFCKPGPPMLANRSAFPDAGVAQPEQAVLAPAQALPPPPAALAPEPAHPQPVDQIVPNLVDQQPPAQ